jgi:ankyrin repeat protein
MVFIWAIDGSKNLEIIRSILDLGSMNINARFHGMTPIFSACMRIDPDTVLQLLEAGADPNAPLVHPLDGGANALHALAAPQYYDYYARSLASAENVGECFKLVLAAGANGMPNSFTVTDGKLIRNHS